MNKIIEILKETGPLTGAELYNKTAGEIFDLWKECYLSNEISTLIIGKRYLRLDRFIEDYARLSPSISREFMTYTVIGLNIQKNEIHQKANLISSEIKNVSMYKLNLAKQFVSNILEFYNDTYIKKDDVSVILAGDIVYEMAHNVPRPERSTGKMVNGSDLDLIFLFDNNIPDNFISQFDEAVHNLKYQYLINPTIKEEIDYIVKKIEKINEQSEFNTFKKMVACKIIDEGILIAGGNKLFNTAKSILNNNGVILKLKEMLLNATSKRNNTEKFLLDNNIKKPINQNNYIFYTAEESEEFE